MKRARWARVTVDKREMKEIIPTRNKDFVDKREMKEIIPTRSKDFVDKLLMVKDLSETMKKGILADRIGTVPCPSGGAMWDVKYCRPRFGRTL